MTRHSARGPVLTCVLSLLLPVCGSLQAEDLLKGGDLRSFRAADGWGNVAAAKGFVDRTELELEGEGEILANGAKPGTRAAYLLTKDDYGDVRVELEFMIPKGSNAGVYLMGRYEVQILDSFGKERVGSGDLGGIYQRWDAGRPKGQQGYGGIAPKANAAKAPGAWQKLEIDFRAPRFDDSGVKIADATFEKVIVNGVLVQEGASTTGPTRSSPLEDEAATGPIAIQGDHGPIAIRRFEVTPLADPEQARRAELDDYWAKVSRAVNQGDFEAYRASCHQKAVLVSGSKAKCYPLSQALARWKQEFDDTRAGRMEASVGFRFDHRYGDATTAHESGVFLYTARKEGGQAKPEYIDFEALLVKEDGEWKIMMEYQKSAVTKAAWDALEGP